MNLDEAGRLQEAWKNKHVDKHCLHKRVIDNFTTQDGQKTGKFVCRECGAIFSDSLPSPTDSSSSS